MVSLASLWLPILVSAVLVFVVSAIVWMVLPYHRTDWKKLPNEDAVREMFRPVPGGMYMFPYCSPAERKDPAAQERFKRGPWAAMTVHGKMPTMGRALGLWFVHLLIVSLVVAYVVGHALPPSAAYRTVFRFASATAFLGFALGAVPGSIWEGKPWSFTCKAIFDGLIYSLVSAGVFGWLWPHA
jgi:hypothetical protein